MEGARARGIVSLNACQCQVLRICLATAQLSPRFQPDFDLAPLPSPLDPK